MGDWGGYGGGGEGGRKEWKGEGDSMKRRGGRECEWGEYIWGKAS